MCINYYFFFAKGEYILLTQRIITSRELDMPNLLLKYNQHNNNKSTYYLSVQKPNPIHSYIHVEQQ